MTGAINSYEVGIVSCDIVGHSAVRDHGVQATRVAAINAIVADTISELGAVAAVWASGGDGGHLILRTGGWHRPALDLIARLRRWSAAESVQLRVTGHVGPVSDLVGADGRTQIVGDGINVAGWLLTRGSAAGVVVSRPFRDAVESAVDRPGLGFHDERRLRDKAGTMQCLSLMSTDADPAGWELPTETDRHLLAEAVERGDGWAIVHRLKRIMQANQADSVAGRHLRQLRLRQLTRDLPDSASVSCQFLEKLGIDALREVVRVGQLVERRYNEYICRSGDLGDTMFLILHGQVGVYLPAQDAASKAPARPSFVHQEGETVGELAFALSRARTADLVALTDTTLLAFSYRDIAARLARDALDRVLDFMTSRVLEHVSQHLPFLVGPDKDGPLTGGDDDWDDALAVLGEHCQLIQMPGGDAALRLDDVVAESGTANDGLYLLVSGAVRAHLPEDTRERRTPARQLSGQTFPLLWVQVPGVAVLPRRVFRVDHEPIKVLYIGAAGLSHLEPRVRGEVHAVIRRTVRTCFEYDAFISYNSGDAEVARRWAAALEKAGLRVFRDEPRRGAEFKRRLLSAIRHSRALVPLISAHVVAREEQDNWVLREIKAHKFYFEECRIYPVILGGGDRRIVSGFRPIELANDEEAAINELIRELTELRDGLEEPPIATSVRPDEPDGF
jgi:CRP-like cAMP-binding protein